MGSMETTMAAFEVFDDRESRAPRISAPRREHLGAEHRPGVCCDHRWRPVELSEATARQLLAIFDESELSESQAHCVSCGAVALYEPGDRLDRERLTLVAYDATARFGLPPIERRDPVRGRQNNRSRR